MEGVVLQVPGSEPGVVRADTGTRYAFVLTDWKSQGRPVRGDRVSFMGNNGQATRINCLKSARESDAVLRVAGAPSAESRFRRGPIGAAASPQAQTGRRAIPVRSTDSQPVASTDVSPTTSPLAIVSLVTGLTGLLFFGSLIAIICGHIARAKIRDSNGALAGDGLARAGLVLGYLGFAIPLTIVALGGFEMFTS